jgi:hypothetical protein
MDLSQGEKTLSHSTEVVINPRNASRSITILTNLCLKETISFSVIERSGSIVATSLKGASSTMKAEALHQILARICFPIGKVFGAGSDRDVANVL